MRVDFSSLYRLILERGNGDVGAGPHLVERPPDDVDLQLPAVSLWALLGFRDVRVKAQHLEE